MKDSLLNLLELQRVDKDLQALEDLKGDLPQQVKLLEAELETLKSTYENSRQELDETTRVKLNTEGELKVLQEKQKKYQEQLYSVTSNREYDAITVEIDEISERIDTEETRILELLETEDALKEKVAELAAQVSSYEEDLVGKKEELNSKIRATENEYAILENKRQDLTALLSKPVLYQYERIRSVRKDTTVVPVNKYACSGCFSAIPPQKVVEIRHMDQLMTCESCGRILVTDLELDNVTSS